MTRVQPHKPDSVAHRTHRTARPVTPPHARPDKPTPHSTVHPLHTSHGRPVSPQSQELCKHGLEVLEQPRNHPSLRSRKEGPSGVTDAARPKV
eukprot:CAMPEP_0181224578 /NCGR_PEP_ID=MMETSP1096-20121128/31206_1 /TAXON_ID=156174 ORGANISM="Chrysochromulina ericina, Strain CCMP281" /NCGR_SAMPLE_ID=MMETSP1096 /ASSEMBLY_ACC=CAM_ASM_000453 /LENGTH=92 /DNA_ID=CAMNT_0023317679 /DNA_START=643 /DNA_END=921 /DNA_ORIENTATION=+